MVFMGHRARQVRSGWHGVVVQIHAFCVGNIVKKT